MALDPNQLALLAQYFGPQTRTVTPTGPISGMSSTDLAALMASLKAPYNMYNIQGSPVTGSPPTQQSVAPSLPVQSLTGVPGGLTPTSGGEGVGGSAAAGNRGEPSSYGRMDATTEAAMRGMTGVVGSALSGQSPTAGQWGAGLLGSVIGSISPALAASMGLLGAVSAYGPMGYAQSNPRAGFMDDPGFRDIGAYFGNIAEANARSAQTQREGQIRGLETDNPETSMRGWFGNEPSPSTPEAPTDPGPTDTASGQGRDAGPGPGEGGAIGGGGEGIGAGGPDAGGNAGAGSRGDEARGGVVKAGGKRSVTFGGGPTGGETGIFIPEYMKRPGLQGKERQVLEALRKWQQILSRNAAGRA